MFKRDLIRMRHMLDAAREALSFAGDKTRSHLDTDRMLTLSIVRCIEVIGEAAAKVTEESRKRYPDILWASIVGMRNRLIHAYYDVDLDRVWDTVTADLPPLRDRLEEILQKEQENCGGKETL